MPSSATPSALPRWIGLTSASPSGACAEPSTDGFVGLNEPSASVSFDPTSPYSRISPYRREHDADHASRAGAGVASGDVPVRVDLVGSEQDARAAVAVLARVWPREDGAEPLPPELAWAFAHSGNYVALARRAEDVVGAAIGFRGHDAAGDLLHSHIAGVLPGCQGLGVGYRLKQHQRSWALAEGVDRVTWTFDPLVAPNGYFNVVKLGAQLTHYYVDFYGPMDDGINTGDETDRCLVTWRVGSARANAAACGTFLTADIESVRARGAVEVLRRDSSGRPQGGLDAGDVLLGELPTHVVDPRGGDPMLVGAWRRRPAGTLV